MEADIIITIALVSGFVLLVGHIAKVLRSRMLHKTIRQALRSDGGGLTPALLDKIDDQDRAGGSEDGRYGIVLLAIGAALFCFGLIQGDPDDIRNLSGIALFPVFVGAALLGRVWFIRRSGEGR